MQTTPNVPRLVQNEIKLQRFTYNLQPLDAAMASTHSYNNKLEVLGYFLDVWR